jgi:hypothetical protein
VKAYIQVAPSVGFAGGQVTIDGCRFGGEKGTGIGQPPACVLLGSDAEDAGTMSGVRVINCDFNKVQGSIETAYHAISCNKAVNLSQFTGNRILGSYTSAVKYNNYEARFTVGNIRNNVWANNVVENDVPLIAMDRADGAYQKLSAYKPFEVYI